jgi:hypothetical protein
VQAVDKLLLMRNFPDLEVAHFDAAEVESQVSCCLVLLLPLLALFERSADSFQDRVNEFHIERRSKEAIQRILQKIRVFN